MYLEVFTSHLNPFSIRTVMELDLGILESGSSLSYASVNWELIPEN